MVSNDIERIYRIIYLPNIKICFIHHRLVHSPHLFTIEHSRPIIAKAVE